MKDKAWLMAGLLTNNNNDVQYVIENITGDELSIEDIVGLIDGKNSSFIPIDTNKAAGKPTFCGMDSEYTSELDTIIIKIRESKCFGELEWNCKNVEIGPLISSALFLDKSKVDSFYNTFIKKDYTEILHSCLAINLSKVLMKYDGKSIIYQCENNEILGFEYKMSSNSVLQIIPVVNTSPVKVVRIADKYRLVDGHCRALALKMAGYDYIPAIVFNDNPGIKYSGNNGFSEQMLIRENPPVLDFFLDKNCTEEVPLSKKNIKIYKVQLDTISINV